MRSFGIHVEAAAHEADHSGSTMVPSIKISLGKQKRKMPKIMVFLYLSQLHAHVIIVGSDP